MDNERELRTAFRRALDDVLPPVPWLETAVTDDLRKRRTHGSADSSSSKTQPRSTALRRPPVQLAAGVLILVLAVTVGVTFLELRHAAQQSAPAGAVTNPSLSTPRGGPVPLQLDGAWKEVADPSVVMILTGTNVALSGGGLTGAGKVAVNGSEIDFYNGTACAIPLPGGIGKYRWTITGGLLKFIPLNSDPCPRAGNLADSKGWQPISLLSPA